MPTPTEIGRHLVADPEVYHGEVTFRGTRIPVKTILTLIRRGDTVHDLAREYSVPVEAVQEAVSLAGQALVRAANGDESGHCG